jgi:gamma-glutamyltranspeptidase/glutathione hydrolase
VADSAGNAASMTLSNGEGSGYIAPGTGIMLNNMLGEDDLHPDGFHASPSGMRVSSMMSPTLVLNGDRVDLIVGSGGSKRIRTALAQVIDAVVGHGMDVKAAVEAPRLHWDGESMQAEPGFAPDALAALERTWRVNRWAERNLYFGGVQAVDPRGAGTGDPRRGGDALRVTGF